jgi:hypothetical protein
VLARIALTLLLVPALLGGACESAPLRLLAPASGSEQTWMPTTIVVDFRQSALIETLEVKLNGNDITGLFTVTAPYAGRRSARADFVWGPGFVLPGTNTLEIEVELDAAGLQSLVRTFEAVGDAYADDVDSYLIGTDGGFKQASLPGVVTGPPDGQGLFEGSLDVFSLGLGGEIVMRFDDNVIVDGSGVDFTVFENAFLERSGLLTLPPFSEPGRVSVSQDGTSWFTFSACQLVIGDAPYHPGCAGVYPVLSNQDPAFPHASVPTTTPTIEDLVGQNVLTLPVPEGAGGDSFDLADVGLGWARYVRIEGAGFVDGPAASPTAGFDLDAVAAVRSAPATDEDENGIPDAVE